MGTGLPARSSGDQTVNYLRAPITFLMGTAGKVNLGTLPAGAVVLRCYVINSVVFNWGTNNLIKVGTVAADTTFSGATLSVAALGLTAGVPLAAAAMLPTADTLVVVTSLCTGTQATTGAGVVVLEYLPVA
jgi:hypothetical protein